MAPCSPHFIDFANVFKVFIGAFYMGVSYWFYQCGLILSIISLLVIGMVTDYCTQLMIMCKYKVIERLTEIDKDEHEISPEEKANQVQLRERIERNITYADIAHLTLGNWAVYVLNVSLLITQCGLTVSYIIFIGKTLQTLLSFYTPITPLEIPTVPDEDNGSLNFTTVVPVPDAILTTSPTYALVVLLPVPFLLACAMLRDVRKLSPVSVLGNITIVGCFFAIVGIISWDFQISNDIEYFKWAALPMFFGAASGAYEGFAMVIPLESSMVGNRLIYPYILHITFLILTTILIILGSLGYLRFGNGTLQIIIQNLEKEYTSGFMTAISVTVCLSVLLTYPIQLYPVIEVLENALFQPGKIFGPAKSDDLSETHESVDHGNIGLQQLEVDPLLERTQSQPVTAVTLSIPQSVSAWKRNLVRVLLVVVEVAIAIVFKDQYAYFSSISGAIGSSVLGYIFPTLIHTVLTHHDVSVLTTLMNVSIMCVFGIIGGSMSIILAIVTVVDRMT